MFELVTIFLQYLGIISISLIIAMGYLMVKNDQSAEHSSISSYAGAAKSQALLAFFALIVFSIPLYTWIVLWLIPHYELSSTAYPLVAISFIGHILLLQFPLIPSNGRRHIGNLLHLGAGAFIALSMLGLTVMLLWTPTIATIAVTKFILLVSAGYMVVSMLAYTVTREKKYFFVFEVIYILLFALCVVAVTLSF